MSRTALKLGPHTGAFLRNPVCERERLRGSVAFLVYYLDLILYYIVNFTTVSFNLKYITCYILKKIKYELLEAARDDKQFLYTNFYYRVFYKHMHRFRIKYASAIGHIVFFIRFTKAKANFLTKDKTSFVIFLHFFFTL